MESRGKPKNLFTSHSSGRLQGCYFEREDNGVNGVSVKVVVLKGDMPMLGPELYVESEYQADKVFL